MATDTKVLEKLAGISTATLTTQLFGRGLRNCYLVGVRPLNPTASRFAGPAFTLRHIPAREDVALPEVRKNPGYPQRKAIETAPRGSVLVADTGRELRAGVAGDILVGRLRQRGVAALVTDGAMRDTPVIAGMDWPVFCAGAAAPASYAALHAVDIQVPIGCAGVAIYPHDILVGDGDGVVVIPQALAAELADAASEQERYERFVQSRVAAGHSTIGLYPPGERALADYAEWQDAQA